MPSTPRADHDRFDDLHAGLDTGRDDGRTEQLVDVLTSAFHDLMQADPDAFRIKFRKMAADPFAFFRGTATVFYTDLADLPDPWVEGDDRAGRVWIQGDLHAQNFGTYLDSSGRLVFDVNDFDEAYLGHWTWDPMRFAASLALLGLRKALPDDVIADLTRQYARAYVEHVRHYVEVEDDTEWALTLTSAEGAVLRSLHRAKLKTRVALLDTETTIQGYRRRFSERDGIRRLEDDEHARVLEAYSTYLGTIPGAGRRQDVMFDVLDVVSKSGLGIGSAGLPAYSLLLEGFSQALDNDVVVTMKQANRAAPTIAMPGMEERFEHHGHRTAVSQRALQAHADRFLGWTELAVGDREACGFVVREYSPYEADLDWEGVTEPDEIAPLVRQLGRATAKIHCVSDDDSDSDVVDFSVEHVVADAVPDPDAFADDLAAFGDLYGRRARRDHHLFVDAFRAGAFDAVTPTRSHG
jgi:uncharacterized protein (DUF2252 family)